MQSKNLSAWVFGLWSPTAFTVINHYLLELSERTHDHLLWTRYETLVDVNIQLKDKSGYSIDAHTTWFVLEITDGQERRLETYIQATAFSVIDQTFKVKIQKCVERYNQAL